MIIVCGAHHGGTTLVASILNAHPQIHMLFENLGIIDPNRRNVFQGDERNLATVGTLLANKLVDRQFFTFNGRMENIENWYLSNKYIFIYRDGRDYMLSHKQGYTPEMWADTWNRYVDDSQEFIANNPGKCTQFKYEELLVSPVQTEQLLMSVCAFIGLPFHRAMMFFEMMPSEYVQKYGNKIHYDHKELWKTHADKEFIAQCEAKQRAHLLRMGYPLSS